MFDVVSRISPVVGSTRGCGLSVATSDAILLAATPDRNPNDFVASVENTTLPTRTHPASIIGPNARTISAPNAVRASNVALAWSSQNSSSTIDVDSSITNTTSAKGWHTSSVLVVNVAVVVVVVVVVVAGWQGVRLVMWSNILAAAASKTVSEIKSASKPGWNGPNTDCASW